MISLLPILIISHAIIITQSQEPSKQQQPDIKNFYKYDTLQFTADTSTSSRNFISYFEIKNRLQIFPDDFVINSSRSNSSSANSQQEQVVNELKDFKEISVDPRSSSVYIGARDFLLRLTLQANGSLGLDSDLVQIRPSDELVSECKAAAAAARSSTSCSNFIQVVQVEEAEGSDEILVCGTNARKPLCEWRSKRNPREVIESFDGIGKSSHLPSLSSIYLRLENGDYIFATSIDYTYSERLDFLVDRSLGSSKHVRTDQYNSNWLNEPVFVGSLELGEFVYVFLRENAVEFRNCRQRVHSRVVRLCKRDQGFGVFDVWRSFEKATLNCSAFAGGGSGGADDPQARRPPTSPFNSYYSMDGRSSGSDPFYFDEIQHVHFDKAKGLIYAIFSTALSGGVKGSAVCVYDQASLDAAFNGPFQHQKRQDSVWEAYKRQEADEFYKCETASQAQQASTTTTTTTQNIIDSQKFQLKHLSVQPVQDRPILVQPNTRLLHLAIDSLSRNSIQSQVNGKNNADVMFISTEANTILKYSILWPSSSTAPNVCLLEEIELFDSRKKPAPMLINNLKLLSPDSLLIATSLSLIRLPLASCHLQTNYFSCLAHSDPYCVWNSKSQQCLHIKSSKSTTTATANLHQNPLGTCPSANLPVDGGFSDWSAWTYCLSQTGERCKCRMRACNRPEPRNGGKSCDESLAVEIASCEVNGGWTVWSAWSACRVHSGLAANFCEMQNPQAVVGVRTRTRTCTNPAPRANGRLCVGHDQEEEPCSLDAVNPCLSNQLSVGQWSMWGAWDECSRSCGEGFQMRRRVCNGKNSCVGSNQEWRVCNAEPCKEKSVNLASAEWILVEENRQSGLRVQKRESFAARFDSVLDSLEANSTWEYRVCDERLLECRMVGVSAAELLGVWSEFSEWSECEAAGAEQTRTRTCLSASCFGQSEEVRVCGGDGWACWADVGECRSAKTSCASRGMQLRRRSCLKRRRQDCVGESEQTVACFNANCSSKLTDGLESSAKPYGNGQAFGLPHLAISCLASFMLGSLIILTLICLNLKAKSKLSKFLTCCPCCCQRRPTPSHKPYIYQDRNKKKSKTNFISSADQNSENTTSTTATTTTTTTTGMDILNIQTSSSKNNFSTSSGGNSGAGASGSSSASSVDSETTSAATAVAAAAKEYFTIGNRFDTTGLNSLLNDIIPDNENEEEELADTEGGLMLSATLKRLNKHHYLPNKSFNTYSSTLSGAAAQASKELLKINSNAKSQHMNGGINGSKFLNYTSGTLRSAKLGSNACSSHGNQKEQQSRASYASGMFTLRTNLDQDV